MPLTGAQARTQLADRGRNPTSKVIGGNALGGHRVHIQLIFQNKTFTPEDFYDALVTLYGAGKVSSDKDTMGRNDYQFRIIP